MTNIEKDFLKLVSIFSFVLALNAMLSVSPAMADDSFKLITHGKYAEAELYFPDLLKRDPTNADYLLSYGICLIEQDKVDKALETFFSSLKYAKGKSQKAITYYFVGRCFEKQSNTEKANENFEKAFGLDPQLAKSYLEIANNPKFYHMDSIESGWYLKIGSEILQVQERSVGAATITNHLRVQGVGGSLRQVGEGYKKVERLRLEKDESLRKRDLKTTKNCFQQIDLVCIEIQSQLLNVMQITSSMPDNFVFDEEGGSKISKKELDVEVLKKIDTLMKTRLQFKIAEGVFYMRIGQPLQAKMSLSHLSSLEAEGIDKETQAEIYRLLSECSCDLNDVSIAKENIEKAMEILPNNLNNLDTLARVCELVKDYSAEAIQLKRIVETNDANRKCRALAQLSVNAFKTKNRIASEKYLEDALQIQKTESEKNGKNLRAIGSIGLAEAYLGKYSTAIRHLTTAILMEDGSNWLQYSAIYRIYRALCYFRSGDPDGAKDDLLYLSPMLSDFSYLKTLAQQLNSETKINELVSPPEVPVEQRWAFVVGVSEFADTSIPKLKYASKDAKDVKEFLLNTLGFKEDHVHVLTDKQATRQNVLDQLGDSWLPKVVGPNDLVFLFISTHGTPAYKDVGALNYIVAYDTDKKHLFTTGIPMQQISLLLSQRLQSKKAFIVVDTCYSGATGVSLLPNSKILPQGSINPESFLTSNSQLILSASGNDERSWESKRYENGIFTRQLMNSLTLNKKFSDFKKLFPTIAENVKREAETDYHAQQIPALAGQWDGLGLQNN